MNAKGAALGGSGAGLRGNKSAPMLFKADSGREIFTQVTRITADRASSRAFAAEMLPKLGEARGAAVAAANGDGGAAGGAMLGEGGGGGGGSLGGEAEYGGGDPLGGYGGGDPLGAFGDSLAGPRREIEEINRRLALLEQERLQIHQLKHMAMAAGSLAAEGATAAPPPVAAPAANLGGGSARMRSSSSLQALDRSALGGGGGALPPAMAASRSTAQLSAGRAQRAR